jgi:protein O-mannosyl-transferase
MLERIGRSHRAKLQGALLIVLACASFWPSVNGGYVLDDDIYVTNNADLRSTDGLNRIWFQMGAEPDYYTLVYSTFWVEYHLWGLAPLGYHAVNVALHALGALLLWRLLLRLRVPAAWLAAAIFTVHPICVESIAWITELKNTLSQFLALASMLCYLRFERAQVATIAAESCNRRWRFYAAALVLFAAALLSKTAVVALPAVLLVIYWWKRGSIGWRTAAPLVPLFLMALAMGAVTIWIETHYNGAHGADWSFSPLERLLIAGRALWFYAGKLIWPHPLAFFYPRWSINTYEWWQYLYPAAALVTLAAFWLARSKIGRGPLAAVLIFAGVLLPVLGFVNTCYMRCFFVADHLQYQAAGALTALATAAVWTAVKRYCSRPMRSMAVTAAAMLLGTFVVLSWRQCRLYADAITLNHDTLAKNPDCWLAHNNLGVALIDSGRVQDAIKHFEEALRLRPNFPEAENNLGHALLVLGNASPAMEHFQLAIRLKPDYAEAHDNLGNLYQRSGRLDDAIQEYETALKTNPNSFGAHNNLGIVLRATGRIHAAIDHCQQAVRLQPDSPEACNNYGNALLTAGQAQDAIEQYQHSLRMRPKYLEADLNLAIAYARIRNVENAEASAQAALALAHETGQTLLARKIDRWLKSLRTAVADRGLANPASESSILR